MTILRSKVPHRNSDTDIRNGQKAITKVFYSPTDAQ